VVTLGCWVVIAATQVDLQFLMHGSPDALHCKAALPQVHQRVINLNQSLPCTLNSYNLRRR
jgi:hypothetical protein